MFIESVVLDALNEWVLLLVLSPRFRKRFGHFAMSLCSEFFKLKIMSFRYGITDNGAVLAEKIAGTQT